MSRNDHPLQRLTAAQLPLSRQRVARRHPQARTNVNPIVLILIVILVLAAFGGLPSIGLLHAGYFPSGIAGLLVLILLILLLTGRL